MQKAWGSRLQARAAQLQIRLSCNVKSVCSEVDMHGKALDGDEPNIPLLPDGWRSLNAGLPTSFEGGFHRSSGLGAALYLSIVSLGNILDPQISGCAFKCTSYDFAFFDNNSAGNHAPWFANEINRGYIISAELG